MPTSTVKTVPDWAEEYVTLYAERARELSANLGGVKYPPTVATDVSGVNTNVGSAIDGSTTTFATIMPWAGVDGVAVYSGLAAGTEDYTRLQLRVSVKLTTEGLFGDASIDGRLEYSINGGSTWTQFWNSEATTSKATASVDLPVAQDFTQVQVRATAIYGFAATGFLEVYDIYILGNFALEEGTAGSLQVYSGPIFAAQNQDEIDGIAGLAVRGRYGDQVITKAIAYEDDVINSGYLSGTKAPFLAALASVTNSSSSSFASFSSRIGRKPYYVGDSDSTFLAQTLTTGTAALYNARISAAIYADNFRKERVIQDHALGYGVEMGKHALIDAETLRRAGLYQREYVQYGYTMSHKLFLEEQELAVVNLEVFGNCLRALTGSQQTTTQDYAGGNKVTAAVGMGMAGGVAGWYIGAELGAEFGFSAGGPYGAAIGFVVGAAIGYFSSQ
jgi:hypothetical protein